MEEAKITLPNGLVINAENPEMHSHPHFCKNCRTFYYFRHVCPENIEFPVKHKAMKLGMKGFFDGQENNE